MTPVGTAVYEANFLVCSNPFQNDGSVKADVCKETISAQQICKLIKNSTFAYGAQQIVAAFIAVAGKNEEGQPVSVGQIYKLCMEVTTQSYARKNSDDNFRIWFDPFSGRLELSTAGGKRDSLKVWSKCNAVAA